MGGTPEWWGEVLTFKVSCVSAGEGLSGGGMKVMRLGVIRREEGGALESVEMEEALTTAAGDLGTEVNRTVINDGVHFSHYPPSRVT
jgi:hypothetical protein